MQAPADLTRSREFNANELSKARRVVIPNSLSISKGFENGIGSKDLLREIRVVVWFLIGA